MSPAKIPPKPSKEVVYVDVDDEITSIIAKVEDAKGKVVALVLPKRATMLQSIINMRLLARGAQAAAKNIVLITAEEALMPLAGVAGIHVAKTLQSVPEIPAAPESLVSAQEIKAEKSSVSEKTAPQLEAKNSKEEPEIAAEDLPKKINYDRSVGELAAVHETENPETIALGDEEEPAEAEAVPPTKPKAPKDKSLKVPNFDRFRLLLGLGVVGFIALVVFIYLALFVLPKAAISIQTSSTPVTATLSANTSGAAKALDETNKTIPSVSKTSDQNTTTQVTATGQQNNGDKAKGTISLTNCTSSPVTVPAGTGVSGNGLTYITQSSSSLDSGNFTSGGACKSTGSHVGTVSVVAQQGGAKYNTTTSSYAVAGYPGVTGSGLQITTQGTDNIQTILTQADVDGAASKVSSAGTDAYSKTFESQLTAQGFYVLTSTLNIASPVTTATPAVGQQATTASVTVKVTYSILAVQKTDLSKFITDQMNGQIDKTKQKLSDNLLNDAAVSVQSQSSPTDAALTIKENTTAVPIIDANSVKKLAEGKKSGIITTTLEATPGVKNVDVKLSPFWVSKVPNKPAKITVTIKEVKS